MGVVVWLSMIGISGTIVGSIQFAILESSAVADTTFDWPMVGLFAGFTASMIIFYSLVPVLIKYGRVCVLFSSFCIFCILCLF